MIAIKQSATILKIFAFGTAFNLVLFGVKLYVGLSVNSICIWSDAVNNLADALSCLVSLAFSALAVRRWAVQQPGVSEKSEQLLSFLLSAVVAFVGVSFAYSSLERLMYPTPVWFSMKYFSIVLLTVLAKVFLFFFYRRFAKRTQSPVLRVLQADSLMDCFITTATLLSFTLTQVVSFAVDAVFGLLISGILFVGAAKLLVEHLRALLNLVPAAVREKVEFALSRCAACRNAPVRFFVGSGGEITAYVSLQPGEQPSSDALQSLAADVLEQTGVALRFVLQVDKEKTQGRSGSDAAEESNE